MHRMFRRDRRKAFAPNVPPILQEANMAFDKGEYGRAAERFEKIARAADERDGPHAPSLLLQAGRARVFAGQTELGMPSIKRGLELFAQRRQFQRLQQVGTRIVHELNERGLNTEADEIRTWLIYKLPESSSFDRSIKRPVIPPHCPACGAPLKPDEVEWMDESTAECVYCGSPVREEN